MCYHSIHRHEKHRQRILLTTEAITSRGHCSLTCKVPITAHHIVLTEPPSPPALRVHRKDPGTCANSMAQVRKQKQRGHLHLLGDKLTHHRSAEENWNQIRPVLGFSEANTKLSGHLPVPSI